MPSRIPIQVFIASSSEGYTVAKEFKALLLDELRNIGDITLWNRSFELSVTYIESLEEAVRTADVAVFVLTPDDLTVSREKTSPSPRDNVLFELGLFMGRLGRRRCFIVMEHGRNIKVPTDLLGVETANFERDGRPLGSVLDPICVRIGRHVIKQGKHPFDEADRRTRLATLEFCNAIEGAWWERHDTADTYEGRPEIGVSLSYFVVEPDYLHNSVCLSDGRSFDGRGSVIATWKSLTAHASVDQAKMTYLWRGWLTKAGQANHSFHGFGEIDFALPRGSGSASRGSGRFWDVDEMNPARTNRKSFQIERIVDDQEIAIMNSGKDSDIRSLVQKKIIS